VRYNKASSKIAHNKDTWQTYELWGFREISRFPAILKDGRSFFMHYSNLLRNLSSPSCRQEETFESASILFNRFCIQWISRTCSTPWFPMLFARQTKSLSASSGNHKRDNKPYINDILVAISDWRLQTGGTRPNKLWVHSDNARPHTTKMSRN
jgi:hypothetical protein